MNSVLLWFNFFLRFVDTIAIVECTVSLFNNRDIRTLSPDFNTDVSTVFRGPFVGNTGSVEEIKWVLILLIFTRLNLNQFIITIYWWVQANLSCFVFAGVPPIVDSLLSDDA